MLLSNVWCHLLNGCGQIAVVWTRHSLHTDIKILMVVDLKKTNETRTVQVFVKLTLFDLASAFQLITVVPDQWFCWVLKVGGM